LRAFPRLDAATRHRVWLLVVIVAAALPVVDLAVRANPAAHAAQPARALAAFVLAEPVAFAALALWAIASLVSLARLGISLLTLMGIRRRSIVVTGDVAGRVALRTRQLGVRSAVGVRSSEEIGTPICVGFVRGTILIPQRLLAMLAEDEIDFVLVHELEHLRRFDGISNLFAKIARSILIWNPVLFFVERRIAFERELACDETVVALCGRAHRYARCLATVMLSSAAPSAAMPFARTAQQGLRRIELLLRGGRRKLVPAPFALAGIAGAIALALFLAASAPQLVALDVPAPAGIASQSAPVVVPAAFEVAPAVVPSAAPFAAGRLFALKT
jgi:beta-lactamase regulating signal transducer with metallopeptidase domain